MSSRSDEGLAVPEARISVTRGAIQFSVRGQSPSPWGNGVLEWAWRRAIADAVRLEFPSPIACDSKPPWLTVEIVFSMTAARIVGSDLDNLAKPVLDTLFLAKRVQAKEEGVSGVLFACDDARVARLVLEKREVATAKDAGVDVTVEEIGARA